MDDELTQPSQISRRFLTAWYAGDEIALRELIHPDIHFTGPAFETRTAAAFLDKYRHRRPDRADFEVTKELQAPGDPWFYSEHIVDLERASTRFGARMLLKEGRISSFNLYVIEYRSIEAARAKSAVLVVQTEDYEEMLALPVSQLAADEATVATLVADLENVLWRDGYQKAETQQHRSSIEYRPRSWYKPEFITAQLYLGPCIRRLGIESLVEDVLLGKRRRLDLPEGWPPREVQSLAELRSFRRATVVLYCGVRDRALLSCKAALVVAADQALDQLLFDLEGLLRRPIQSKNQLPEHTKPSRVQYITNAREWDSPSHDRHDLHLLDPFELRGLRQPILDVLQGRAPRLQLTDSKPTESG